MTSRLDVALVTLGLAASRTQAQTLIRAGVVRVGGVTAHRASLRIDDEQVELEGSGVGGDAEWIRRGWVGRGALKLDHALSRWPVPITGRRCLDVGACTGGFTQVLLERGAGTVLALDVGHGQLDAALAGDPRVVDLSGVSIRDVVAADIGGPVDVLVSDLSFISLAVVLPLLPALCRDGADLVLLVKPQFEVGRGGLGKGGVVRSADRREKALADLDLQARQVGLAPIDLDHSPITGGNGNIEYLLRLRRCSHPGTCPDPVDGMMGCGPSPQESAVRRKALTQEERV